MRVLNQILRYIFSSLAVIVIVAFSLHALQISHQHFGFVDSHQKTHLDHSHEKGNSKNSNLPDVFSGLSDYLHGSDKKDILSLLLALAYLSGTLFIGWPKILIIFELNIINKFKFITRKPFFIIYLRLLFAIGVLNPKIH